MKDIIGEIRKLASEWAADGVQLRRKLHAHPELAFEEFNTAAIISEELLQAGIQHRKGVARTGIIALIEGKNPTKKTIALRADMDALPITETNNCDYRSVNEGKMHACGHDVHMACLVGAARILHEMSNEFQGSVKLIFQPSEEKYPGGATVMISEGVLKNPDVEIMIGQHVHPGIDAGKAGFKAGTAMASTDEVYITVKGKGGHAATPELNTDPVVIASHVIIALQQVVSRMATPTIPTVLSFGKVIANGKTNVIPDEVFIEGTLRTVDEQWRSKAHESIRQVSEQICSAFGGSCHVFIDRGYPFLHNDEALTRRLKKSAQTFLGPENVSDIDLRMTAEDFAYYSHLIPSCFYRLGVRFPNAEQITNLHTSCFSVDENALETGAGLMAWLAIEELNRS